MEVTAPARINHSIITSKAQVDRNQNNTSEEKVSVPKENEGFSLFKLIGSIINKIAAFFGLTENITNEQRKNLRRLAAPDKRENLHQVPVKPSKGKILDPNNIIEPLAEKELEEANEKLRDGGYSNSITGVEELIKDLSEENKGIVLVIDPKDKHIKKRLTNLIPTLKGFGINVIALDYNYGLQPLIDQYYKTEKGSIEEKQLIKKLKTVFRKNRTANQDMALFEALRENKMKLITTSDIKEPSSIERILKRIEAKDKPEDWEEAKYALILSKDKADSLKSDKHTLADILGAPSINMHTKNYRSDTVSILKGPQHHGDILKEQDFRVELPRT